MWIGAKTATLFLNYSWDKKKVFDSVSKPLTLICWQRIEFPNTIAQSLVDRGDAGYTIVFSSFSLECKDLLV